MLLGIPTRRSVLPVIWIAVSAVTARFPKNENIQAVLLNNQRPGRRFWLFGWPTLLYGAEENQCTR